MAPDVVRFSAGWLDYAVFGLQAKADGIRYAAQQVTALMASRRAAAVTALRAWTGPHSATFAALHTTGSDALADLAQALMLASMTCATFPSSATASSALGQAFAMARTAGRVPVPAPDGSVAPRATTCGPTPPSFGPRARVWRPSPGA